MNTNNEDKFNDDISEYLEQLLSPLSNSELVV